LVDERLEQVMQRTGRTDSEDPEIGKSSNENSIT
jgi:hypothetical protein